MKLRRSVRRQERHRLSLRQMDFLAPLGGLDCSILVVGHGRHVMTGRYLAPASSDCARAAGFGLGGGSAEDSRGSSWMRKGTSSPARPCVSTRGLNPASVRRTVIEAEASVLGQFPAKLVSRALERIRTRCSEVRLDTPVAEIAPDHVRLGSGETLPTRTTLWTAGVAPAPLISTLGLGVNRGRLILDDAPQARDHPNVFAVGDAAPCPDSPVRVDSRRRQPSMHNGKASRWPAT